MVIITCPHCNKSHEDEKLINIDDIMEYIPEHLQDTLEMRNDND